MKNAKATTRGWINPRTGELLKVQKMTQEKADMLNGVKPEPVKVEPVKEIQIPEEPKTEVRLGGSAIEVEKKEETPKSIFMSRLGGSKFKLEDK